MAIPPRTKSASGGNRTDVPAPMKDSLISEIVRMASVFGRSRERGQLSMLGAGLLVVVAATAYMQIRLNAWNRPFYDALTPGLA